MKKRETTTPMRAVGKLTAFCIFLTLCPARAHDPSSFATGSAGTKEAPSSSAAPAQASAFAPFAPGVKVRWDEQFLFVESHGLPAHNMMTGITAWQQQVPLPQDYTGANAWRIPLAPVPAATPIPLENHFLRGAIALAVNGVPIFNPQNNRGELSYEIGELDQWGGHCGRADDYHYHIAPLHLQEIVSRDKPIAYALDGYPIYGLTEPDGSTPANLDTFGGHSTEALGYHYHASEKYPYVIGGFHGEVTEREGQVDPQPRARPVRPALPPLRGARIIGFTTCGNRSELTYKQGGTTREIVYTVNPDNSVIFNFPDGRKETFHRREEPEGPPPPRRPRGE